MCQNNVSSLIFCHSTCTLGEEERAADCILRLHLLLPVPLSALWYFHRYCRTRVICGRPWEFGRSKFTKLYKVVLHSISISLYLHTVPLLGIKTRMCWMIILESKQRIILVDRYYIVLKSFIIDTQHWLFFLLKRTSKNKLGCVKPRAASISEYQMQGAAAARERYCFLELPENSPKHLTGHS